MALTPDMSTELRNMVREVLREVGASRAQAGAAVVEPVRIGNDHELADFVARVIEPAAVEKIRAGKLRFTLGSSSLASLPPAASATLSGVVTEVKLEKLAGAGRIILEPDAVLTPLARDKARKLGLTIERRR